MDLLLFVCFVYGVWWLVKIPHRNKWGKTIAWAKKRGYSIPKRPPSCLRFCLGSSSPMFSLDNPMRVRLRAGKRYVAEMQALNSEYIRTKGNWLKKFSDRNPPPLSAQSESRLTQPIGGTASITAGPWLTKPKRRSEMIKSKNTTGLQQNKR